MQEAFKKIWEYAQKKESVNRKELSIVFCGFTFLVFGILLATGTLFSGIHLVDDHEMIRFTYMIQENGLLETIREVVLFDIWQRFRPLYYTLRVCMTAVLGYNYVAWGIMTGIIAAAGLWMGYLCGRKLGCVPFTAALFTFVIWVGPQSVVWWKTGPQEGLGTTVFLCGFYLLLKWLEEGNKKNGFLAAILFTLTSLYKESYIMMLFFPMLYVLIDHGRKHGYSHESLKTAIKKYGLFWGWITLVGLVEGWYILFDMGPNHVSSAGLDPSLTLLDYMRIWYGAVKQSLKWYVIWAVPMLLFWPYSKKRRDLLEGAALAASIILPQMFIYCKSGITERYVLPWVLGYAWFFVLVPLASGGIMEGDRRRRRLLTLCLCGFLAVNFIIVVKEALYHTYRGKCFERVWDIVLENSDPDTQILAAYSPYPESARTILWLGKLYDREHVNYWYEDEQVCRADWGDRSGQIMDVKDMDIVLFYSPEHRHYCYEPSLDLSGYDRQTVGTLVVCIKK